MASDEEQQSAEEKRLVEFYTRSGEAILSDAFRDRVKLGEAEVLRNIHARSMVLRCAVDDGPGDALPASVIVKCAHGSEGKPYDSTDLSEGSPSFRNINEFSGNQFLTGLDADPPLNARCLGGDRETGIILLEDLGEPNALADHVRGDDPARAEASLLGYARGMGRLHAVTVGQEARYLEIRRDLGDDRAGSAPRHGNWLSETVGRFKEACGAVSVPLPEGFDGEAEAIDRLMEEPGPFLAFAPGDTCPDNHTFLPDGIRFFDFEFCGFRHALLDGVYLQVPFPTCWCVSRMPEGMPVRLLEAYREELAKGCPEAYDDGAFYPAAVAAHASWLVVTTAWHMNDSLEKDGNWGLCSTRQRLIFRSELFADSAERHGLFPAFGRTARALAGELRRRWPDLDEMPLYPAFRGER